MAVAVSPPGSESTTVTVPAVAPAPVFVTVKEYVAPVCPRVNTPTCVFVTVRSGSDPIGVTSDAVLLRMLASPPPVTVAVFVTLAGAVADAFTVNVITGYLAPAETVAARVQLRLASVQLQTAPASPLAGRATYRVC